MISYFNSQISLLVILLPISCIKMKHPLFLISYTFWETIEDKLWVGVGLGRCDRQW